MKSEENYSEVLADVVGTKKHTGRVTAMISAVLVCGLASAYMMVPVFRNTVRMAFMKPEKYCASVYQQSFDGVSNYITDSIYSDNNSVDLSASIDFDDEMIDGVRSVLGSSLFDVLNMNVTAFQAGDKEEAVLSVEADERHVISVDAVRNGTQCFFRLPEASEKYLSYDLSLQNELLSAGTGAMNVSSGEITDILRRYDSIIIEYISTMDCNIEKGYRGEAEGIPYKYNRIISEISTDIMRMMTGRIADEMQKDKPLRKITENESGIDYDSLVEKVRNLCDDSLYESFRLITYVDARGDIRGLCFYADDDEKMGFITAKSGDNIVVKASSERNSIIITAAEQNERYTGKAKIDKDNSDIVFDFEDLSIEDNKYIYGLISADMSALTDGQINKLSLFFEKEGEFQKISTDIIGFGSVLLLYRSYNSDDIEIAVPGDCIDISEADKYISEIDMAKFLPDLYSALGVDKRAVSGLLWRYGMFDEIINKARQNQQIFSDDNI